MPKKSSDELVYDFVDYYKDNPVASACDFLEQDLWWGQRITLEKTWQAMYNLMIWGRGCGKSRFLAVAAICKALLNPGEKVVITASSFRQSKMVFKEIEDIYDNSSIFKAACKKMPVRLPDACSIEFTHGSSILAYPLGEGCLDENTLVTYDHGISPIKYKGRSIWGDAKFRDADYHINNGIKPVKKILTKKGYFFSSTYNHRMIIRKEDGFKWARADQMVVGDKIIIDRTERWHNGDFECTDDQAYYLGIMIGDGSYVNKYYLRYTTEDKELSDFLCKMDNRWSQQDRVHWDLYGKLEVLEWLDFWGLTPSYTPDKELPLTILGARKQAMAACLSGLFDTDGTVQVANKDKSTSITVSFCNVSEKLIRQMQFILLHFGIVSCVTTRQRNPNHNLIYELLITGENVKIFADKINFRLSRKRNKLLDAIKEKSVFISFEDYVPFVKDKMTEFALKHSKKGPNTPFSEVRNPYHINVSTMSRKNFLTFDYVKMFIDKYAPFKGEFLDELKVYSNKNIYYDEILSIEDGEAHTFDMYVPDGHRYCANGFFSHNSKIRGARAHTLVIDEAAQVPIDIIEDVLFPMMNTYKNPMENVKRLKMIKRLKSLGRDTSLLENLATKHCVIMSSTAYLRCNHLYERMVKWEAEQNNGNPDYSVTKFTYLDPPDGFINKDQVEMEKKTQPIMRFMMEHLAIFPDDDASSFYPASLVNKIRSNDCPILLSATEPGIYIVGMDPARTSDNCTISVVKVEGDKIKLVFLYAFNNTSFTYVSLFLRMVISLFRPVRVAIDSQGGGYAIYDELNKVITREYAESNLPKSDSLVNLDKIDEWGPIDRIDNIQFSDSGTMASDKLYIIQLVNFTTEWIADSNFKLKSKMQTNPPGVLIPTHSKDSSYESSDADSELNDGVISNSFALIEEMQNIRMTPTRSGAKLQFLASDKRIRRDRYTSFLIACRAAIDYGASLEDESMNKQKELATGFWG